MTPPKADGHFFPRGCPLSALDDREATRHRLVEAEAALAADPTNQRLADQVDRLTNQLEGLEWVRDMQRCIVHCRLIIDALRRRN